MDRNILSSIFQPSGCLSREELKAYLEESISPEGRRRVEHHLLDCPLCSDSVEGFSEQSAIDFSSLPGFDAFQAMLPAEEDAIVRKLNPAKALSRVAAVAAVFLIGAVAYFNFFQPADNDQLYSQFYTIYQNDIPLNRRNAGDSTPLHPAFEKAINSYKNRAYEASLPAFEDAIAAEPGNDAAKFYAGMALLETAQWEKAATLFDTVQKNSGSYASKSAWYLALVYLKQGKKEAAKTQLNELAASSGYKSQEAKKLLEKL